MIIPVQRLLDRLRHPRSRADEVAAVRRRLEAQPGRGEVGAAEAAAAGELLRLREAFAAAVGEVSACGSCATGHPLPHGRWDGGHCCGARTEQLFTDDELGALRLSGTTAARLRPPVSDHAGCAFRGPEGCSLAVADRPTLCVRYVCPTLDREIRARGDRRPVGALADELNRAFTRFAALRAARLEAEAPGGPSAFLVSPRGG